MAATERSFDEFLPQRLYLDTQILIAYLIRTHFHHQRCRAFLERVVEDGRTTIYLSSLSWMEFAHVVMRKDFRASLPDAWWNDHRLHQWGEPEVRQGYLRFMVSLLEGMLRDFEWYEVQIGAGIRTKALEYMWEYNLKGQDACHLAAARFARGDRAA